VNQASRIVIRVVLLCAALLLGTASLAQADRSFQLRYSVNETGSIKGIANTNMTCTAGVNQCANAQSAGVTDSVNSANDWRNNNAHSMVYIDVDSDGSTFNSSSANQSLPAGSTVLYAALYWGGHSKGATSPANASLRDRVKLKLPGGSSYNTVTADTLDLGIGSNDGRYQAFADVTNLVKPLPNAGNGTYTVADIQAAKGSDRYAGWSLIVAYKNDSESAKNMTIFDGLVSISGTTTSNIPISGFLTPPAGPINAQVGFVTWEGDLGLNGDRAQLNGQYLSDAQHPSNNFFDSRISHNGALFTDRNPAYPNSLGMDAAWTTPPAGSVGNSQTSATITVRSTGDQYLPGVITFQTEIFAPKIDQAKTVVDENGGDVEQGDLLTYKIAGKNNGQDGTSNFVLRDPIPANTTYVPGSIKINKNAGAATGSQTDPAGDDRAEYDSGNDQVVARIGQGSNASVGGDVAAGAEYEVTFQVRVNGPSPDAVPSLTELENVATASFLSKTTGTPLTAVSKVKSTVKSPDLKIVKARTGADFVAGGTSEYTLNVNNHGDAKTQGQVTVTDPLPAGLTATAVDAPGWTCNALPAGSLPCSRTDALPAGQSYPPIVVTVAIDDSVADEVENTSTVSGGGDANLGDNTSSSTNPASRKADLAIEKTASVDSVKIGDTFTYELKVTNNGPSKATSVTVSDDIPAGLSFVSASLDPGCDFEPVSGVVVCQLGTLNSGASATVTLTVKVDGDAHGTIHNVATVAAQQEDPDPSNNTDTDDVDASGADLQVEKDLKSDPTPATGDTVEYEVTVKNNGPSAATGVVLNDALPAGLTNVAVDPDDDCSVAAAITCLVGDLAVGDSFTITVTGKVKPGQVKLINRASATGNEHDPDPSNNEDEVETPVSKAADLAIIKQADPAHQVVPGQNLLYTFNVTNNGPDNVTGITIEDTLPAGVTYVDGAPGCNAVGQVVTCTINFLAAGGSGQTGITVQVEADAASPIANTATVGSELPDPDPSNNTSTVETPVKQNADVEIIKTADDLNPRPGDVVTYTLTAKNNGLGPAHDVVVTDALPPGVSFVSADAPCVEAAGTVTCELGTLDPGEEVSLEVKVKVEPWGSVDPNATHGLDVQKVEAQIDLEAGEVKTVQVECPSGYFASDGSVRIDHVDQGTGDWPAPEVVESRASSLGTWQGTVHNTATGRAQAKIFAVCIKKTTADGGHDLIVSAPVTATEVLAPGRNEAVLQCGPGQVAIQPGFIASTPGDLVYSQPEGNGWKFVYDIQEGGDATFSIRCLTRQVSLENGHTHDLALKRIWTEQTIQPGEVAEVQLICPDGSKGIVGGWDLDDGLVSLGNDPRPVTRAFKVYNPTDQPLKARFSLLCLGDRTGGEHLPPKAITNTAQISTSSEETDTSNNSSSVTFEAEDTDNHDPIDEGDGKKPVKNGTGNDRGNGKCVIVKRSVKYKRGKVTAKIKCNGAARGLARLNTVKRIKVGHKRFAKGTTLASGSYVARQAGVKTITLRVTRAGKKILRKRSVRKGKLTITGGSSKLVRITR